MPANTSPVYPLTPNTPVGKVIGAAANVKSDGAGTIGTDIMIVFTAGANGSFLESVRFSPFASAAATATTPTTLRLFLSSATSGAVTSANTSLLQEITAGAQTADHSTTATFFFEIPLNKKIQANYTILASAHVINAASTGWMCTAWGGDF